MTTSEMRLSSAEAIPLAYALVARVAADHGIRALAIKGVVLAHHGLREPRVSADIDVMVHPDDLDAMQAAMESADWRLAGPHENPQILGHHSIDLLNDHWPIGLDLHSFFPGFLAPASEVFEILWQRRIELPQAGHPVQFTDLASSAAIAALHHLRSLWRPENETAFDRLVEKASTRLDASDRADLSRLSEETGCVRPLAPFFDRIGMTVAPSHPAEDTEYERWMLGTTAHPYTAWWYAFKELPWRERPRYIWYALVLSPDEIRAYHGDHASETPLWKLRVQRVTRVCRAVPSVMKREIERRRKV
ncbi:nucleotidyltransferase family protein [Nocardioides yefusunii]|uniref:Nucleotidyltransferase family protein n=1 Tax=Nocardioides yefusunii TaxID=2500546 RepID=A0ABW1QT14_9ACTN|nr:nucleotidyltransferase family protein [Nocardioides yefusunii]